VKYTFEDKHFDHTQATVATLRSTNKRNSALQVNNYKSTETLFYTTEIDSGNEAVAYSAKTKQMCNIRL
jgi:hypothetical protein